MSAEWKTLGAVITAAHLQEASNLVTLFRKRRSKNPNRDDIDRFIDALRGHVLVEERFGEVTGAIKNILTPFSYDFDFLGLKIEIKVVDVGQADADASGQSYDRLYIYECQLSKTQFRKIIEEQGVDALIGIPVVYTFKSAFKLNTQGHREHVTI